MSDGKLTTKTEQLDYIHRLLAHTGWSPSVLAKRAGLDPSTLSRFLSNQREDHALRPSSIARLGDVTGLPPYKFGQRPTQGPTEGFGESEASLVELPEGSDIEATVNVLRARHANVDAWTLNSRALELAGYRQGDILIVGLSAPPIQGDVVCAQVYDWNNNRADTVFRIYQPPFLLAATTEPKLMKPYFADDDSTAIRGVVLHTLRPRAALII
jgi:transcriptional regulator with XRE-family HTH domain